MHMLQSILLATDFGPASQEAAKVAVKLAPTFESYVRLLHVNKPIPNWKLEHQEEATRGPLEKVTAEFVKQNVRVDSFVAAGSPAHSILSKAQEIDADLILIGAGDRTGQFRFSSGPTAQTVIEQAAAPVLAVRPKEPALRFRNILCPVDQSATAGPGFT